MYNYARNFDSKNSTGVVTSKVTIKVDLASLKSEVDRLDIGKSETTLLI